MFQMSEKQNEQNQDKIKQNKEINNTQKPSTQINVFTIPQKSSYINNVDLNNLIDDQKLDILNKELENIAITGTTKYSWKELKPYIIYFYEKNVKNYLESQKICQDINFLNSEVLPFPFSDKKESKEMHLDLNNSNEHTLLEDKNLNLIGDFHLNDENHLPEEVIKMNNNNKNDLDENIEKDIVEFINKINLMPFTIQRIAELLLDPKKYYSSLLKYNRAFFKLVNIDFD
jgi:hypothetical protein